MNIKWRLTLWYVGVTLAIILALNISTYYGMRYLLYEARDAELEKMAANIEKRLNPATNRFEGLDKMPQFQQSQTSRYFHVSVYGADGKPLYRQSLSSRETFKVPLSNSGNSELHLLQEERVNLPTLEGNAREVINFRAMSRKVYNGQQFAGWINTALPIHDIENAMSDLFQTLLWGSLLVVLATGAGGYFLTRKALLPVREITQTARNISRTNLDQRVNIHNSRDELGELSVVLNELLERLQKSFNTQQSFLSDAAHELKTPLAVLRSHWEGELNNPDLPHNTKEKLVKDIETLSRLSYLINHLLLLSQTEEIQSNFKFDALRIDELIEEVVADAQILATEKEQVLEIVANNPFCIQGDRIRLYQLIFNLIDNAVKYTPSKGRIAISQKRTAEHLLIEVTDNGPGISQEHLPHLFNRFYRVDKDRSRKTGGSGLGLAICKLIAEAHGGIITINSEPGVGSSFCVKLPREMVSKAATGSAGSSA